MSEASGLPLLSIGERNPLVTSTFGTGELIAAALDRGYRNFVIGLGGSATNDAGTGMLTALGARFLDKNGQSLKGCGQSLEEIESIDLSNATNAHAFVRRGSRTDYWGHPTTALLADEKYSIVSVRFGRR